MVFYILFFIFYIFFGWFKPKYALGLILLLLPTYQIKFQIWQIPFTFLEAMVLILFICWAVRKIKDKISKIKNNQSTDGQISIKNLKRDNWFWLILVWLAVATVSMFIAPDLRAAAGVWKAYFLEPILFLIIFVDLIRNKQDLKIIYAAILFLVYSLGVVVFYQKMTGQGVLSVETLGADKILRPTGLFSHPNFLGLFLGPLIVLAFSQIVNFEPKKFLTPINSLILLFLGVGALFFARSEGAIIGLAAGIVFYLLFFKKIRKYVLIGLVAAVLLAAVYPTPRQYFLEKAFLRDLSGQFRLNIWSGATSLLKTSPILGVGLDGYEKLISDYQAKNFIANNGEKLFAPPQPYPHNLFLAIWLEMGLAGLVVFLWMIVKFFKQGFEDIKKEPVLTASVMGAMVCVLVHGLVDTPYFKNDLAILFWLIIGMGMVVNNLKKEELIKGK
jgi:putative inorganic carbon (HCO3(-)) transporter